MDSKEQEFLQSLRATFRVEAAEHLQTIGTGLLDLEKTPALGKLSGIIATVFRAAHSLKGAARAVDLHPVEGLAHRLETLFSRVRQGVLLLDRNVAGVVQQVLDASEDCVTALGENRPSPVLESALRAIEQVLGMEPEAAQPEPPRGALVESGVWRRLAVQRV